MTTTDEARVTDELSLDCGDNSCLFAKKRGGMRTNGGCRCLKDLDHDPHRRVAVARYIKGLADRLAARDAELAKLRAERGDMVALLEATGDYQSLDFCDGAEGDEPLSDECYDEKPCWAHRAAALLAKVKGGTP